jgi:hypothetical protein
LARVPVPDLITAAEDPGPWAIWLYGLEGAGKTVLAYSFPDVLGIDTEKSRRSLLNHKELVAIPIFPVYGKDSFDKFRAVVDRVILANNSPSRMEPDLELIRSKKTLVIDTWSTLQMKELNTQMLNLANGRHPDLPSEAEFNINNTRLRKALIDLLEQSGKNLIIISHIKEEKDDQGNTIIIRPGNSPSISQTVGSLVDGIFFLQSKTDSKGETTRKLTCVPSMKTKAKNRFSAVISKEIENPTAQMIVKAIEDQQNLALEYLEQQQKEKKANA